MPDHLLALADAALAMRRARRALNENEAPKLPPQPGKSIAGVGTWLAENRRLTEEWRESERKFNIALDVVERDRAMEKNREPVPWPSLPKPLLEDDGKWHGRFK